MEFTKKKEREREKRKEEHQSRVNIRTRKVDWPDAHDKLSIHGYHTVYMYTARTRAQSRQPSRLTVSFMVQRHGGDALDVFSTDRGQDVLWFDVRVDDLTSSVEAVQTEQNLDTHT